MTDQTTPTSCPNETYTEDDRGNWHEVPGVTGEQLATIARDQADESPELPPIGPRDRIVITINNGERTYEKNAVVITVEPGSTPGALCVHWVEVNRHGRDIRRGSAGWHDVSGPAGGSWRWLTRDNYARRN